MVDRVGLENQCTARYRGFESLLLCKKQRKPSIWAVFLRLWVSDFFIAVPLTTILLDQAIILGIKE